MRPAADAASSHPIAAIAAFIAAPTLTAAAIAATKKAGFTTVALSPSSSAIPMEELFATEVPDRVALMVGTEGPGLTAESMAAADVVCLDRLTDGRTDRRLPPIAWTPVYAPSRAFRPPRLRTSRSEPAVRTRIAAA